jgi:glutamate carboxypeptidase
MPYTTILDLLGSRKEQMLEELERLVANESPSHDKASLDRLAQTLAGRLRGLGGETEIVDNAAGGNHVVARFTGPDQKSPALVLGHFDTVWPIGTLARMPVREETGRLFGPGIFDMKASLVMTNQVLEAFQALGLTMPRPLIVLYTSDEEIGSPGSRPLIEDLARKCEYVLVLEPPLADGSLKTARKGVGRFTIEIEGKAAHAGVAPESGASAIVELAHQILRIQALNGASVGTTVNVGVVQGGTTANVVPARAVAEVDVRVSTQSDAATIERELRFLKPVTPGTRIKVEGRFSRPPMERTAAIASLFARAREIGLELGQNLNEGSTGGGSDGNFTAALGVPTLDGLGALGDGAHAESEHIVIESMPPRAALLAALLLNL